MTAAELIEKLQQFDPAMEVRVVLGNFDGAKVEWPDEPVFNDVFDLRRINQFKPYHGDGETYHSPTLEILIFSREKFLSRKK
jgi:hypothetical protein